MRLLYKSSALESVSIPCPGVVSLKNRQRALRRAPVAAPTDIAPLSKAMPWTRLKPLEGGYVCGSRGFALRAKKAGEGRGELFYPAAPYGLGPFPPVLKVRGQAALTAVLLRQPGAA
jgi:hypothetical protein